MIEYIYRRLSSRVYAKHENIGIINFYLDIIKKSFHFFQSSDAQASQNLKKCKLHTK